jgi:hypothetical protein
MDIDCLNGCPPPLVNVNTTAKQLRWVYVPPPGGSEGKILLISGLPTEFFVGGRRDGSDYVVDYIGAPEGREWTYGLDSSPACPKRGDADEQAQLTSGP